MKKALLFACACGVALCSATGYYYVKVDVWSGTGCNGTGYYGTAGLGYPTGRRRAAACTMTDDNTKSHRYMCSSVGGTVSYISYTTGTCTGTPTTSARPSGQCFSAGSNSMKYECAKSSDCYYTKEVKLVANRRRQGGTTFHVGGFCMNAAAFLQGGTYGSAAFTCTSGQRTLKMYPPGVSDCTGTPKLTHPKTLPYDETRSSSEGGGNKTTTCVQHSSCSSSSSGSTQRRRRTVVITSTNAKIVQSVVFDMNGTYTGDLKTVIQTGYGISLGIYDKTAKKWATSCRVTSKVLSRRAEITIEFTALVSSAKTASASAYSKALQKSTLTTNIVAANTALGKSVTVPTVSKVNTSKVTVYDWSEAVKGLATLVIVLIIVGVLVAVVCPILICCCCCGAAACCAAKPAEPQPVIIAAGVPTETQQGPPGAVYMKNGVWMDKDDKPMQ